MSEPCRRLCLSYISRLETYISKLETYISRLEMHISGLEIQLRYECRHISRTDEGRLSTRMQDYLPTGAATRPSTGEGTKKRPPVCGSLFMFV